MDSGIVGYIMHVILTMSTNALNLNLINRYRRINMLNVNFNSHTF